MISNRVWFIQMNDFVSHHNKFSRYFKMVVILRKSWTLLFIFSNTYQFNVYISMLNFVFHIFSEYKILQNMNLLIDNDVTWSLIYVEMLKNNIQNKHSEPNLPWLPVPNLLTEGDEFSLCFQVCWKSFKIF